MHYTDSTLQPSSLFPSPVSHCSPMLQYAMETFEKRKAETLASMTSSSPDKSPKGSIDEPIISLLNAINSHPSYFTTSSCSGRISVLSHPTTTTTKKKAKGGKWVFITHHKADPDYLLSLLFPPTSQNPPTSLSTESSDLVLRFEPLIIAIECKDIGSATKLVSLAISCGFRESGITSVSNKRVIIAVRCSIRLEVPIGGGREGILVSPEYVRYLVGIANDKMEANWRRTDGFLSTLMRSGFGGDEVEESGGPGGLEFVNGDVGDEDGWIKSEGMDSGDQLNLLSNRKVHDKNHVGSSEFVNISLPMNQMRIVGEPVERLFLWGHSACTLDNMTRKTILIFGGFGGIGRHARRNDSSLLDPLCCQLETISVQGAPSPRMGHTSSMVGDRMVLIGGRADPVNILNDVWVLNPTMSEWKLVECTGSVFPPRHRHAAAAIDSKIYVFGGLGGHFISSALYVLDISHFEWNEIRVQGEWPSPRHSHTLAASGSKLYMFGGYDGDKALGDLYSFDTHKSLWKKENMAGRTPHARFSHSMFVYKDYLGIIGGCTVGQHYQELVLLDLRLRLWKYVMLNSIGKDLFVRCTASVVGDDLVVIGGGASCYAFGTKFSEPIKINLLPLLSLRFFENDMEQSVYKDEGGIEQGNSNFKVQQFSNTQISNGSPVLNFETEPQGTDVNRHIIALGIEQGNRELKVQQNSNSQISNGGHILNFETEPQGTDDNRRIIALHWVLQLERKHAKFAKDILKKFGWLDLGRKAYSVESGVHICFPITEIFCTIYLDKQNYPGVTLEELYDLHSLKAFTGDGMIVKDCTCLMALDLLMALRATLHADEIVKVRKVSRSPLKVMSEAVASLIMHRGLPTELLDQLPTRWDRLGDIVVLPVSSFKDPVWDSFGDELWPIVAKSLGAQRLARQGRVAPTGTRDSTLEILVGENGWVEHCENGILYCFDSTKCMFSWGNLSEKLRMARLDCRDEVIVELFSGIGYFVLPFLVRANAKMVYACDWNPHAVEALRRNLHANSVAERCIILEGDNRVTAPKGVADRVCLGLLPTSEGSWVTAVKALRNEGGMLHVHGNVKDSEEGIWTAHVLKSISEISRSEGHVWEVSLEHLERVKWYAPHIRHVVVDVRCKQIQR